MRLREQHNDSMAGVDADIRAVDPYTASQERFESNYRKVGKTTTMAVILFTVGSLMIYYGVQSLGEDRDRGISMCTVGAIAFLPGSYACYHLYGAWARWPGFTYDLIPSYDD